MMLKLISLFNFKVKQGVVGRKTTFSTLNCVLSRSDKTIWMHCASLGEFEQGLPVLKALKDNYKTHKIVVSFFSPSGYENKKNTSIADTVVYLPVDIKANAKRFLDIVNPQLILFVKYDIWPNFLFEIKRRKLKAFLISANFRSSQAYFKWYGGIMRKALLAFDHIFTQNEHSKKLLNGINYQNVSVAGDTRFDRVYQQLNTDNSIDFIETFKNKKLTIVFGSSWPEDDTLFIPFINNSQNKQINFIIAPHNVNTNYTKSLFSKINKKTIAYSNMEGQLLSDYDVFILDTIGYLSKVYSYADIAYVGGAAGKTGLHNILEPAVFSIPIIIGKHFSKFPEAVDLVGRKGVFSVTSSKELCQTLTRIIASDEERKYAGTINLSLIEEKKGAVIQIIDYIRKLSFN